MTPIAFSGGLVLVDDGGRRLHHLNAAAAAIWTVLDCGLSIDDAADVLAEAGGGTTAKWRADIVAFRTRIDSAPDVLDGPADQRLLPRVAEVPRMRLKVRGRRFAFGSEDAIVFARVSAVLAACASEADDPYADESPAQTLDVQVDPDGALALSVDGDRWLVSHDEGAIVGGVFHRILVRAYPDADWLAMIHAGAVCRNGGAVVLAAVSGSGKSTLAAHLSRYGFDYLSDDLAAVDGAGRVAPWPTPISVKDGSWAILASSYPELAEAPDRIVLDRRLRYVPIPQSAWDWQPVPVRAIVIPCWRAGVTPHVQALAPDEALALLMADRIWLGDPITVAGVRRFLDWLAGIPVHRIVYPDLVTAQAQVEAILAADG